MISIDGTSDNKGELLSLPQAPIWVQAMRALLGAQPQ